MTVPEMRFVRFERYDNGPWLIVTLSDVAVDRRWVWWERAMCKMASVLYALGVISSASHGSFHRDGARRQDTKIHLTFDPRPYVLYRRREHWFHWPRFGHGYYEVMGMCGKCAPWPCCGAVGYDHLSDCAAVAGVSS